MIVNLVILSLLVRKYKKSYCTKPGVGICSGGGGVNKSDKFYVKVIKTLHFLNPDMEFCLYLV